MSWTKWSHQRITLTFILTLVLVGFTGSSTRLWAKPAIFLADAPKQALEYEPPPRGAPGDRKDGGRRRFCPETRKPFTALGPATNWGETVAEHPTFWLYVPYQSASVELVLYDEENNYTDPYRTTFQVTEGPGIISFRLPPTAPLLKVGRMYRWQFFFFCNPTSQSDFLSVSGVVVRVEPSSKLMSQLEAAKTPRERVIVYAKNGLWHETLSELAELRRANPQDAELATDWAALLQHPVVRLEEMVSEPLVPCCTSERSNTSNAEDTAQ
jgi:hypothetical protein